MPKLSEFAIMVTDLRNRSGLSKDGLQLKSGVSSATIRFYENDKRCKIKNLRKIYYPLCKDDAEYQELLYKAAIKLDGNHIVSSNPGCDIADVISSKNISIDNDAYKISKELSTLHEGQKQSIIKFIKKATQSKSIMKMIEVMVETE